MNRLPVISVLALLGSVVTVASLSIAKETPKNPADPGPALSEDEQKIDYEPIPWETKDTKSPKAADWVSAKRVKMTKRGARAAGCRAWRTRNWVKVHCDVETTATALLGGSTQGVSMWMPEPKEGVPAPGACEVMFPIRPGDRRVFELFSFGETYGGSMVSPGLVLQEYWLEGESAPTILLY